MSDVLNIGFTGTRHGMSDKQALVVMRTLEEQIDDMMIATQTGFVAHHGDCRGADEEFHRIVWRSFVSGDFGVQVEIHPGPVGDPHRAYCQGASRYHATSGHMKRNAAIVAASHIMIAAPYEDEPQPRGGTWATIGMARKALKRGTLRALYVVGREGQLLEHEGWKL